MLKKLLGFDPQTMTLRTEIIAGITTFLTMSYILAVNPHPGNDGWIKALFLPQPL